MDKDQKCGCNKNHILSRDSCVQQFPFIAEDFDSLTTYELIEKVYCNLNGIVEKFNKYDVTINDIVNNVNNLNGDISDLKKQIEELINFYVYIKKNGIPDDIIQKVVSDIVKYVFFGLTNDGYFCAYIPKSWDFLNFDTITDCNCDMYGHLVMRW